METTAAAGIAGGIWRLLALSGLQSLLLASGQLTLKLSMRQMPQFEWNARFWSGMLTNWWFALCGLLFLSASLFWVYILRHYPLTIAYPLASLSYVFATLMAMIFFKESVTMQQWLGILLIMGGVALLAGR